MWRKTSKYAIINPRAVKNKTIALSDFIPSYDFDVVALTETWLGSAVDKTYLGELVPCGYLIKHVPRNRKRHGGGVAVIYKASITLGIVSSTSDNEFSQLNTCTVK